jgi:hypothetical protein
MTPCAKITACIAVASVAAMGLAACSSGSSASPVPSSSAASSAASPAATSAASAAAPDGALNIAPELISTYFGALCTTSEENDGLGGSLSADGMTCSSPDGWEITVDVVTEFLNDPKERYGLLSDYYDTVGESDVADCITYGDYKNLGVNDVPAVSDTCVTNVMNATLDYLAKK